MTTRPPEPADGQDPGPPDVRLAVRAAVELLGDIDRRKVLDAHNPDLALRVAALRRALLRLRDHLGAES